VPRIQVREAITQAAIAEFHRRGYASCSVDTIAKTAGVPKGSFYNHFPSKEHLGAEAVAVYAATSSWWNEVDSRLSPVSQLRARFQALVDEVSDIGFRGGCLIGSMGSEVSDHSAVIRVQVSTTLDRWSESIVETLRAAQAEGEIADDLDVERLGRFVLDAFQGAVVRCKVVRSVEPYEDFLAVVFGSVLR
jgi:TetR/AcrR family transcriptional regulator, transcriptional repressor for nem operon